MSKIVRTISEDGGVICCAIDSTDIVGRMEEIHKTSAVVTAGLGRLLSAASMMGAMMKSVDDTVTLRMAGGGPTGALIAVSDGKGNVRGYVENPIVEIPLNSKGKLDVGRAIGNDGFLNVIKDLGIKEPYIGNVPIVSGEVAEDITSYYAVSEQIPTVCALGVLVDTDLTVKTAGGFLLQLLPGATEECISKVESNIRTMVSVTKMLDDGFTPKDMAFKALEGFNPNVLDEFDVAYKCNCSKERVEQALVTLGAEELEAMATEQEETKVECHFCEKRYIFSPEDLRALIKDRELKK